MRAVLAWCTLKILSANWRSTASWPLAAAVAATAIMLLI
jgi:hypothetical protein